MPSAFVPHTELAARVLPLLDAGDGAHDLAHILRVWRNAQAIAAVEGSRGDILVAATLLHDCVVLEKSSPLRSRASALAAERATEILGRLGWAAEAIAEVGHAVAAHSFSAGIVPLTLEARVLQDADRLDALGHIGIARCFYTAGRMGSSIYDADDVSAAHRPLDDTRYALDHFRTKLLRLGEGFQTATGARMAAERIRTMAAFVDGLEAELKDTP